MKRFRWTALSLACWALDWVSTAWALEIGGEEGNPFAAHWHGVVGIHTYAVTLLPILFLRGVLADNSGISPGARVARAGSRLLILFHIVVLANNFWIVGSLS